MSIKKFSLQSDTPSVVAIIFSIGVVIGFIVGKVPTEVITGFAGIAITWVFRDRVIAEIKKRRKR